MFVWIICCLLKIFLLLPLFLSYLIWIIPKLSPKNYIYNEFSCPIINNFYFSWAIFYGLSQGPRFLFTDLLYPFFYCNLKIFHFLYTNWDFKNFIIFSKLHIFFKITHFFLNYTLFPHFWQNKTFQKSPYFINLQIHVF